MELNCKNYLNSRCGDQVDFHILTTLQHSFYSNYKIIERWIPWVYDKQKTFTLITKKNND